MKNIYGYDKELTTIEMIQELEHLQSAIGTLSNIYYMYDLVGYLHQFKLTKKGFSCYDSLGNYIYIRNTSKIKWYTLSLHYKGE